MASPLSQGDWCSTKNDKGYREVASAQLAWRLATSTPEPGLPGRAHRGECGKVGVTWTDDAPYTHAHRPG